MASAKFQGNRFKIDGEIAENHRSWLIIFNLTASSLYNHSRLMSVMTQ